MRGVRGKRGVSPLMGLCALFRHSVGHVIQKRAHSGLKCEKTAEKHTFLSLLASLQIAQKQRGQIKMLPLIYKQVKGKGPPPYPHFSHRPAIAGRTERKAQLLHKKVGLSAIYRRGQEMQIVPF